jgi:S1-C subfamily serine protease
MKSLLGFLQNHSRRMNRSSGLMPALLGLSLLVQIASAQNSSRYYPSLAEDRYKSGTIMRLSFTPVAETARHSIVKLDLDGKTVAVGAIIDANGLVITKASELKEGKLTCSFANGQKADAQLLASDEGNDVALVKVSTSGLKPIVWASEEAVVGQWVVTPGLETAPEAVGIVSVPPRKILPKRALIGVTGDPNTTNATITGVSPGYGADKAGLKPGDVILSINGAPVGKWVDLSNTLRQFRDGQIVKLRVLRGEQEFDTSIEMMLESLPTIGAVQDTNAPNAKIASVARGSGAAKAELKPGDVILAANDRRVEKWDDLFNVLRRLSEGQIVKLRVLRDDKEFDAKVEMMTESFVPPGVRGRGGRGQFNRQDVMNRMGGELSRRAEGFELAIQHDTVLQPWQCGGPLVNLDGKAVGLNIARAGRVASYALPAALVNHLIEDLKAQAEKVGKSEKPSVTAQP